MFSTVRIVFQNPPYVDMAYASDVSSIIDAEYYAPMGVSLLSAVQAKLDSIDTSQCVELQRFVTLTSHEFAHYEMQWLESEVVESKPLLYDGYGSPISFWSPKIVPIVYPQVEEQFLHLQLVAAHHLRKLALLSVVFDLIDRVVKYWNEVALARRAWKTFSGAFRQLLERALQFKPLHTPLRLFPNSIHPIGSAA